MCPLYQSPAKHTSLSFTWWMQTHIYWWPTDEKSRTETKAFVEVVPVADKVGNDCVRLPSAPPSSASRSWHERAARCSERTRNLYICYAVSIYIEWFRIFHPASDYDFIYGEDGLALNRAPIQTKRPERLCSWAALLYKWISYQTHILFIHIMRNGRPFDGT